MRQMTQQEMDAREDLIAWMVSRYGVSTVERWLDDPEALRLVNAFAGLEAKHPILTIRD